MTRRKTETPHDARAREAAHKRAKWARRDDAERARHTAYARAYALRRNFGLTEDEYEAVVIFQNGVCAICKRPPKKNKLSVDHDHSSGLVRGLLSHSCNRAIAMLGHDVETLRRAIDYLEHPPAVRAIGQKFGVRGRVTLSAAGRARKIKFVRVG